MIRLYHYFWTDLGLEEPHPARALLYIAAAVVASLLLWCVPVVTWLALGAPAS